MLQDGVSDAAMSVPHKRSHRLRMSSDLNCSEHADLRRVEGPGVPKTLDSLVAEGWRTVPGLRDALDSRPW